MNALIDGAISHARTVISALVLLIFAGVLAYNALPKESDPDINIPVVYVSLTLEGVSPEDAERLLLRPMEKELRQIEGVKEMRSTAYQGGGNVTLEFDAGFDVDKALEDVRNKVDQAKPELPDEADEPTVNEVNFSLFPVLVVSLSGDVPERTLLRLARQLRDKVEALSSVLRVRIAGDREELVELVIDPLRLESYGLRANDIVAAVGRNNRLVAAGTMDTGQGRFAVKVPGLFETAADILDMPLKVNGDAVVRARDVATLQRTYKDAESYARINGRPSVALEVTKRTGQNIIETTEAVRALVEAERQDWPEQIQVTYSQDRSTDIRNMLQDLQNNLTSAVLLVMILVIAVLGLRSGLLVGVAIPGSFLIGILVLAVAGLTINIVVLFSLILAVGMLVDGAIVLTEYADRKMAEGQPRREAYRAAAKTMFWPILASTSTTIAAFVPLMFWPGVVGEFMKFLPITLTATLAASFLMAMIFVPTLGSLFGRAGPASNAARMQALETGSVDELRRIGGLVGGYVRLLALALRHPAKVLVIAFGLLVGVYYYYGAHGHGVEFFPDVEPETAVLHIHARGNLSIDERDVLVREVENQVLAMQAARPEFKSIFAASIANEGGAGEGNLAEDVIGTIQVEFASWDERRKAKEIIGEIRERAAGLAGIAVEPREAEAGPPVGKPIHVQLSSRYPDLLLPAVAALRAHVDGMRGVVDVEDTRPVPGIEWEIAVDRAQAAKFGADVTDVGSYVQLITKGMKFGEYRPDDTDDEVDIVARFPADARSINELDLIRVPASEGFVPISNFITRSAQPRVGVINRVGGERVFAVKADVAPGILVDDRVREIRAWLGEADLDPRIRVTFKGEDEEQQKAQAFLGQAFLIALFVMAIILVTQFNSFYSAGLILTAVIMSTVGVLIGLLVTAQPFGIVMSGIGVIALAGIVVNNNIILIDTYDQLKTRSASPLEAVLRTGAQRLRPVLMTTVTTILGLLPMVLRVNIDFFSREVNVGAPSTQWWTQLATAIVFGLAFASLLTLVVTPSALMLKANIAAWRARRRARRGGRASEVDGPALPDADARVRRAAG
jgi:multidrug efflux pump